MPAVVRGILDEGRIDSVTAICANPATLRTSSMGRLFDAVAALCGLAKHITYEGEAAIASKGWPQIATRRPTVPRGLAPMQQM